MIALNGEAILAGLCVILAAMLLWWAALEMGWAWALVPLVPLLRWRDERAARRARLRLAAAHGRETLAIHRARDILRRDGYVMELRPIGETRQGEQGGQGATRIPTPSRGLLPYVPDPTHDPRSAREHATNPRLTTGGATSGTSRTERR